MTIKNDITAETITLRAEIDNDQGRALDPQAHDPSAARGIATDLCNALTQAYTKHDGVRPETLAVAVQTVLETLLSGVEREGVHASGMRVALANSLLVNGDARVQIEVGDERVPSILPPSSGTLH